MADRLPARLQEQRQTAIAELQERLQTWKTFQEGYTSLEETLKFLPGKVSHEIMVPFGSLAFMPGKLIHTNEILVLLGDNWFAERSASQAAEIVKRRQQSIEENITSVNNEIDFFSSQLNFAQEMGVKDKSQDGIVEIKEEMKDDSGPNRGPRVAYKKAKDFAPKRVKEIDPKSLQQEEQLSQEDEDLFAKLDRLEALERTNRELNDTDEELKNNDVDGADSDDEEDDDDGEDDYDGYNNDLLKSTITEKEQEKQDLHHSAVSFSHEAKTGSEDSNDSDDSNTNRTIMVNFTKPPMIEEQATLPSSQDTVNTPTDIYKRIKQKPKSILKAPSFEKETDEAKLPTAESLTSLQQEQHSKQPSSVSKGEEETTDVLKAFSGKIIDRTTTTTTTTTITDTESLSKTTKSEPKRISKFKAQRNK